MAAPLAPSPATCSPPSERLRAALPRWQAASRWAATIVEHGLTPLWLKRQRPPLILKDDSFTICQRYGGKHLAGMTTEIQKLIALGSVREVDESKLDSEEEMVVSVMFPVGKKDGRTRPVINLKTINPYVQKVKFKMEGLKTVADLLRKDWWMVKIDLADAFHHVPLHPRHQRYFRFRWANKLYQWVVMPFGYRDAPRIFSKLMGVLAKEGRARGLWMVVYIDDILLMAPSREAILKARDMFVELLKEFGFTMNEPKSHLDPTQVIDFLGVIVDSRTMTFTLPPRRMEKVIALVNAMLKSSRSRKHVHLHDLQILLGTIQSVTMCVLPTRLHSNALIEACRSAEFHPLLLATVGPSQVLDLLWWQKNLTKYNGRPIVPAPPHAVLDTDASEKGWGAVHFSPEGKRHECQGYYTAVLTSNHRELQAISHGVIALARALEWKDCSVRVRTDNQVSMSYINRMGGREPHLTRVTEEVHSFCMARNIFLTAEYLPGEENTLADTLSRVTSNMSESQLAISLFRLVDKEWGPHMLDCFASATNTQCKHYVSLRLDTLTSYTDFFSRTVSLPHPNMWAFPPFAVAAKLLRKIESERLTMTVLLPVWPAQPWWPLWPHLLAAFPLLLPHHETPLSTWVEGVQHNHSLSWSLIALRLSGKRLLNKAFQKQLLQLLASHTNTARRQELLSSIMQRGCSGTPTATLVSATLSLCRSLMSLAI